MQSPLLTLLRRLEAQNIWRVTYNALPQQQQYNTSSAQHHVEEPQQDLPQVRFGLPGASAASIAQEWYHDESVSVQEALKLLVTRIQTSGPVKQHHLQALYQRCKTGDELDRALKLTRLNYLARGALQQHAPFSHRTSKTLVQQAMQLGVPELAARALEHSAEFGLPADSVKEATPLLIYYSKQGDLLKMLEVYEVIKRQGRHPGPDVCYVLVKGCVDWGRADLARLIIKEFEAAGVRTRQGTLAYLNRRPSMGIESALPTAAEFAGALTDDGAVVERNAARA